MRLILGRTEPLPERPSISGVGGNVWAISKGFVILALAAFLLFAAAMSTAGTRPGMRAASGIVAAQAQAASTPRNLTFYMHNVTVGKDVNGVTTPYVFDTLQTFGQSNTVSKIQEVRQDWYLFPVLAGNLTLNGTIAMHVFVSIDLVGSQVTPTLEVSEINQTGAPTWTYTLTIGSQAWWTTPHDLVLTTPALRHTFAAGSTILVIAKITSGVRTATIWYNASWVPTHLVLQSEDFARVDRVSFLDSSGAPHTSFDPLAANKDITIVVDVIDPLGGYDVQWVNVTLLKPGGASALTSAPLAKVAGTPLSFASEYRLTWNYNGQPIGRYNATAAVLDNSGYYYWLEFYDTDGFLDAMDAFFYIGGLPAYVNVEVIDSKDVPLVGAQVALVSAGVTLDTKTTDAAGSVNLTMAKGTYEFQAFWEGVKVADLTQDVESNVSAASPLVLHAQVYYPIFQALDADGRDLAGASLIFTHPNGEKLGPYKTNETGEVTLDQMPLGNYALVASWRGVDVFTGSETVSGNDVISFQTRVYELTVTASAANGQTLAGVYVSVVDATGLVFDAGVTGADGRVVLRLPAGNYTVQAQYITSYMGSLYDSGQKTYPVSLMQSEPLAITFSDFPLPLTSTVDFLFGILYAGTVAGLLIAFFLLWRKKIGGTKEPAEPEKKT